MKKLLVPMMVLALVALTVPVWAGGYDGNGGGNHTTVVDPCNITLNGDVAFHKLVYINQTRNDTFTTTLTKDFEPQARADAEAVKNDYNKGNTMYVGNSTFQDNMAGSFNDFIGIGQSNQAAGSMNNQGNTVAVAYVSNAQTYASSLAAVGDKNIGNNIQVLYQGTAPLIQNDTMTGSFNRFVGIGQSNQSAGSMNNQNNAVAVAAGVGAASVAPPPNTNSFQGGNNGGGNNGHDPVIGSSVAVAASELALSNTGNTANYHNAVSFNASMSDSFNGFKGIGQSNQAAGNMNNQVNVVAVGAAFTK